MIAIPHIRIHIGGSDGVDGVSSETTDVRDHAERAVPSQSEWIK